MLLIKAISCTKYPKSSYVRHYFKSSPLFEVHTKPLLRHPKPNLEKRISPFGWFLLIVPASTFALGTWQVQRKKWKEDLIKNMKDLASSDPIKLPEDLSELKEMEYRPVYIRGTFIHDEELHFGPRSLISKGDAATTSQLMSANSSKSNQGFQVITPFKLAGRDEIILVNRGWVPAKCKQAKTRSEGQIQGEVDLVGVIRVNETRPNFIPHNKPEENQWYYKDLHQMAQITGALPILLDATTDFDVKGGPIGGQTRINLRNEHLSYILTWYMLSGVTSYLWYKQFLFKIK